MGRYVLSSLLAVGLLAVVSSARADVESAVRTEDGDRYIFKDDLLNSNVGFPQGQGIRVRPLKGRVLLIRPRASFVREMFKSVEKM